MERYFGEGLFQLDSRAKGGDLWSVLRSCSSDGFVMIVWGGGVCRPGLGVLQQQGHRLQGGGENHGLWRPVSGVELGPAVWRAPRGHRGRLASAGPRGSRLLQVRPCLMTYPASANITTWLHREKTPVCRRSCLTIKASKKRMWLFNRHHFSL